MLNKFFIVAFLFCLACSGNISVYAQSSNTSQTEIVGKKGDQYIQSETAPNSTEVNTVEVSNTALEMEMEKQQIDELKENNRTREEKRADAEKYDSAGGGITIISMCIVIGVLAILSILFYLFGNISSWFLRRTKKQKHAEKQTSHEGDDVTVPAETYAAIAAALAQHFSADHDREDTILTIRKLRKAYSPWNSKIYNMRTSPEVPHHAVKIGK